jgi:hypothetical protein
LERLVLIFGITLLSFTLIFTYGQRAEAAKAKKSPPNQNSSQEHEDFGVSGIEVRSVKSLDTKKLNAEISEAASKGETWTKEALLVVLELTGTKLKGHTKTIEVRTPPEQRDAATVTVTDSGYPDDAVGGERWRLWLEKSSAGIWIIERGLWAQLCTRPGHRFYSAEQCP